MLHITTFIALILSKYTNFMVWDTVIEKFSSLQEMHGTKRTSKLPTGVLYEQHISILALLLSLWVKILQGNVSRAATLVQDCWTVYRHLLCEAACICVFTKSKHPT